MAILSKINLYEQPEQHVLSIRKTIRFNDFPNIAKQVYEQIDEYTRQKNLLFSDCPFVCYHNSDLENLDVEMGFPVAKPVSGYGEIGGHTFPVQKVVSGIFLGAYEETDPLMLEILQWITTNGYEQLGSIFNYYLNDGDRPASEQLTKIVIPIR
jgi:effector-binding domain-containing protein